MPRAREPEKVIAMDQKTIPPTPPDVRIPGVWTTRRIVLGERELAYWVPANPDAFLDDAEIVASHGPVAENPERSDIPFWQFVWPSAEIMADLVFSHDWANENIPPRALELGAGVGLVGLAGLAAGLSVTFSDYQNAALRVAASNAERNGFTQFQTQMLDWTAPVADRFSIILGCEVIYEQAIHQPILKVLDQMLAPEGVAWLGDPGRTRLPAFITAAQSRGYKVEIRDAGGQRLTKAKPNQFQLLIVRRP